MQIATSLERHFEQFRKSFRSKDVMVYEHSMVYRTPRGLADKMAKDANDLIVKLNLPLVAIATTLLAKDSFHVKNNETFDI